MYAEEIQTRRDEMRALYRAIPGPTQAFTALTTAVRDTTTLDAKQKEFVALGIAVALRCEPCVSYHVDALIKEGATREELGDVLAMAIEMGGGPALMYASRALACWDELTGP